MESAKSHVDTRNEVIPMTRVGKREKTMKNQGVQQDRRKPLQLQVARQGAGTQTDSGFATASVTLRSSGSPCGTRGSVKPTAKGVGPSTRLSGSAPSKKHHEHRIISLVLRVAPVRARIADRLVAVRRPPLQQPSTLLATPAPTCQHPSFAPPRAGRSAPAPPRQNCTPLQTASSGTGPIPAHLVSACISLVRDDQTLEHASRGGYFVDHVGRRKRKRKANRRV